MNPTESDTPTSINFALDTCRTYVTRHKIQAFVFLGLLVVIPLFTGIYFYANNRDQSSFRSSLMKAIDDQNSSTHLSTAQIDSLTKLASTDTTKSDYILYAFLIVVFGIFTSFYRFHLKEGAKYEHFLLGLRRIQLAASNSKDKYETEVRQSLTQDAFIYETKSSLITKEKRVENPLPGVPSSDIASSIVNKIFESIEIIAKPDP